MNGKNKWTIIFGLVQSSIVPVRPTYQCVIQDAAEINENTASKVLSVEPVGKEHEINISYIIRSKNITKQPFIWHKGKKTTEHEIRIKYTTRTQSLFAILCVFACIQTHIHPGTF